MQVDGLDGDVLPPLPDTFAPVKGKRPVDILAMVVDRDRAVAQVEARQRMKRPLTDRAAWLLARSLQEIERRGGNAGEAADMALERGWMAIKPDWYLQERQRANRPNRNGGVGTPGGISSATAAILERARQRGDL